MLRWSHALLLAGACFGVYANGYDHAFVLDSQHVIVDNAHVRSLASIPRFFTDATTFSTLRDNVDYRPVLMTTYALNHALGGYVMGVWHLTQVLLHALCALGLYALCVRVLRRAGEGGGAGAGAWIAFFAALVFALHPTGSGVVNYLSARSSLLTAALLLPAIVIYMVPVGRPAYARAAWWAALLYTAALFTKVEAVACLGVFLLYDVWQTGVEREHRAGFASDLLATLRTRTLRRMGPMLAATGVYFLVRRAAMAGSVLATTWHDEAVGPLAYLTTQLVAWWHYVRLWFVPMPLVADNAVFPVHDSLLGPPGLALLGWFAVLVVALAQWRRRPQATFLLGSFLALLSPTSSFVPLSEMVNEHRPYLPLAVLSLTWMIPLGRALGRTAGSTALRIGFAAGTLAVLATLATLTWQRNTVFATRASYWADVVEKAPSARAYANHGLTFMRSGDFDRARELFERSLALKPYWHITHINLGIVLGELGDDEAARRHFDLGVEHDRGSGWALAYRGDFLLGRGDFAAALADYEASAATNLHHYANARRLATAHAGLGHAEACYRQIARCFEVDADRAPFDIVGILTPFFDDPAVHQAGIDCLQMLEADLPDVWWVHANIGLLASRLGQTELAEQSQRRAEQLRERDAS